jgi:hypothetical protein
MSFGNVPRDASVSSLASLRSTATKSSNGYFSADIRTVGALLQYQRSPGVWVTAESLTVPATQLGNVYTFSTGVVDACTNFDGSVVAVPLASVVAGSVLSILTNNNGQYIPTAIPIPPDSTGITTCAVSLSDDGNVLAFGAFQDNGDIGAVYIYAYIAGAWTIQGTKITGPGEIGTGLFGFSLSLNGAGDILAIGSPQDNGQIGAAYIFNLNNLAAPVFVTRLVGTAPPAVFGFAVNLSADGSTLAVGASASGVDQGSAFVFTKIQGTWTQQAKFDSAGLNVEFFGDGVSLSSNGNILVISSLINVFVSYRSNNVWSEAIVFPLPYNLVGLDPAGGFADYYGCISQDGNTICTSSPSNDNNIGASWIFTQGPLGKWIQNGPGFIGTGAATPALQGNSKISGNGKTVVVWSANQGYVWIFV